MGRLSRWLCLLWLSGVLGVASGSQRPCWYYGELGGHYGPPEPYQQPAKFSFPAQTVVLYSYWAIQGILATLAVFSVFMWVMRACEALKNRMTLVPLRQEDPEESALMETLHLLDAVMVKMWRHLCRLERRKRRRAKGHPKALR